MANNLQDLLGRKPSVLIVDDDEDLLLVLQLTLASNGFDVVLCPNANNFFELLASVSTDVVILDITMNGVDGSDICRQLKENYFTINLPVLMLSANRNVAEIATQCRADSYVSKPFEVPELIEILNSLIKDKIA